VIERVHSIEESSHALKREGKIGWGAVRCRRDFLEGESRGEERGKGEKRECERGPGEGTCRQPHIHEHRRNSRLRVGVIIQKGSRGMEKD